MSDSLAKVWGKLISLNPNHPHVDISGDTVIGRNSDCTISFPQDQHISGKHCRIHKEDGVIFVEDFSSNGTFINGQKVGKGQKNTIRDGDELTLSVPTAILAQKKPQLAHTFVGYLFKDAAVHQSEEIHKVYDIRQELGTGNFATVKLGIHKKTGEKVAIKIIDKKKFALNPSLRKDQLLDEVRVMKSLIHPNILAIKDIFESDDYMYLVLELATGGDLFDAVVNKQFYPEDEAREVFGQLASAVGYLHDQGIAHRDLKPENILMANPHTIKLSDFGLSKIIGEEQLMKTLCGTPQYLAPEIIFQSEGATSSGYSKAVDIWSMGVILYILLAGFPPFGENSFEDIKKGRFSFDDQQWDTVSAPAKDLIRKLMTVDPKKRYTVEEIFEHPWMKKFNRVEGEAPSHQSQPLVYSQSVDNSANNSHQDTHKDSHKHSSNHHEKKHDEEPKKEPSSEQHHEDKAAEKKEDSKGPKSPRKRTSSKTQSQESKKESQKDEEQKEEPKKKTKVPQEEPASIEKPEQEYVSVRSKYRRKSKSADEESNDNNNNSDESSSPPSKKQKSQESEEDKKPLSARRKSKK